MINGIGTSVGFAIAIVIMAGIREKIEYNDVSGVIPGNSYRTAYSSTDVNCVLWILRINIGGRQTMSITGIILAAAIVGGTGLFIGVFLGIAGKKFAVEVDRKRRSNP